MENVVLINKELKKLYGTEFDGKSKFRLVWSEDLIEKRVGRLDRYTPSGIYLGTDEGVHEVKKYSYFTERWILENYNPAYKANPEIAYSDGYEPLFVFDKNGQYLKPYLWACQYIIEAIRNPGQKRTEKMDRSDDEIAKEREIAEYFDFLTQEGTSPLGSRFSNQEALILPGKEFES